MTRTLFFLALYFLPPLVLHLCTIRNMRRHFT